MVDRDLGDGVLVVPGLREIEARHGVELDEAAVLGLRGEGAQGDGREVRALIAGLDRGRELAGEIKRLAGDDLAVVLLADGVVAVEDGVVDRFAGQLLRADVSLGPERDGVVVVEDLEGMAAEIEVRREIGVDALLAGDHFGFVIRGILDAGDRFVRLRGRVILVPRAFLGASGEGGEAEARREEEGGEFFQGIHGKPPMCISLIRHLIRHFVTPSPRGEGILSAAVMGDNCTLLLLHCVRLPLKGKLAAVRLTDEVLFR